MNLLTVIRRRSRLITLALVCLVFGLLVNSALAVEHYYFDVNGTTAGFGTVNGGSFNWDGTNLPNPGLWSDGGATGATTTGTSTTVAWVQGSFPRFNAGANGQSYTVTANNEEQIAGIIVQLANVTINGTGSLKMAAGLQGLSASTGASLIVNVPITGTGQVQPNSGGSVSMNATNTYTGGTSFNSSATLVNYNNNASFSTGLITNSLNSTTGFVPLLGHGGTTITLANNWSNGIANSGINFGTDSNTPIVSTGTWSLGANTLRLRNNGDSTSPLTLSNTISGAGGMTVSANNNGTIFFSGSNTYTGVTTISQGATANNTVTLSVNTLADGNSNSSIGKSTNAAANLVFTGGILKYTGAATTTDRNFTIGLPPLAGVNAATIDASGGGTLKFTSTGTIAMSGAGARTLVLTGSNTGDNTLSQALPDQAVGAATSLVKNGGGTWILSNTNPYNGPTSVNVGTLLVNGSNTGIGAVTVASGATLGGTGSVVGAVNVSAGGTLSPGSSPESLGTGTLTFSASAASASHLVFDVGPGTQGDLVNARLGDLNIADSTITGSVAGTTLDLVGAGYIPTGNKYTVVVYDGNWNQKKFKNDINGYVYLAGANPRQFLIKYNDVNFGGNFSGESLAAKNANAATRFVTLVAVPELGSFLTMGLVGCFAWGAVRLGKRFGFGPLRV